LGRGEADARLEVEQGLHFGDFPAEFVVEDRHGAAFFMSTGSGK
jgi:hypothetical protein